MEAWKQVTKNLLVLNIVKDGFFLPLFRIPPKREFKNSLHRKDEARRIVQKFESLDIVKRVPREALHLVSPIFLESKKDGTFRLILNLRYLNLFCKTFKFKLPGLRKLRHILLRDDYMISIDLKKAYYHVRIQDAHHKYLGFCLDGVYYCFTALPMGGNFAPFFFQKLAKQVPLHIQRTLNIRGDIYLDDGMFLLRANMVPVDRLLNSARILNTFTSLGWLVNMPKSMLEASRQATHLGMQIDTELFVFRILPEQKQKIIAALIAVKNGTRMAYREFAKLPGRLMAQSLALGHIARIYTKALYAYLTKGMAEMGTTSHDQSFWEAISLPAADEAVLEEIEFWLEHLKSCDSFPIRREVALFNAVGSVDASENLVGGFLDIDNERLKMVQPLPPPMLQTSSTLREAHGYLSFLQNFVAELRGKKLLLRTDNQCLWYGLGGLDGEGIANYGGSSVMEINELLKQITSICINNNIELVPQWLSRDAAPSQLADQLSKFVDHYDYGLRADVFDKLQQRSGPFGIDMFASAHNAKTRTFCSWHATREAVGNGLSYPWNSLQHINIYAFPPIPLISFVITKMIDHNLHGIIILPHSINAAWWPLIATKPFANLGLLRDVVTTGPFIPPSYTLPTFALIAVSF